MYSVYIVTNKRNGTLYTGVTSNLVKRAYEHREGLIEGFSKRYKLNLLVYYKVFDSIESAIKFEKQVKRWNRQWKLREVREFNPEWRDIYFEL